jgi:putative inorganic carbon (HCO3(-)) transporter
LIAAGEVQHQSLEAVSLPEKRVSLGRLIGNVVFPCLLLLIVLTSIPYGSVEPLWEAVFECVAFGLAALSIVELTRARRINWSVFGLLPPLVILLAFAFVQTLSFGAGSSSLISGGVWSTLSADPFQTRRWILKMLAIILTGAMLLRYTASERRLRALIITILALGGASGIFGILRQTTQRGKGFLFLSYLPPDAGFAQFINKNHFAFLAEMALGLALGFIVSGEVKKEKKLIYLALSLPLWAGLALCNSRGGLFSMFGQLLFLALMWTVTGNAKSLHDYPAWSERLKSSRAVRVLLFGSLLVFMFVGTIWMGGDELASRLEAVPGEINNTYTSRERGTRIDTWRATLLMIKEHPVAGVGFGGYWAIIPEYHNASGEVTPQEAHNDYLELLASGGVIGLLPAAWFMFAFIKRARRGWSVSKGYARAASLGALAGIFGVALHSLVDFGLHINGNALLFTALVVIATLEMKPPEAEGV